MPRKTCRLGAVAAAVALALPFGAARPAPPDPYAALQEEIRTLRERLEALEKELAERRRVEKEVEELKREVKSAAEWKSPNTLIHMAGYADVGFTDQRSKASTFSAGSFNPILHYQYRDLVMLESELSMTIDELGESEVELEYLTIDWFAGDHVTVVAGKFLSPIGWFRQNLHPSWINKLPSAPIGFGHDQAAPNAEVGLQVRGGLPFAGDDNRFIYAFYVGNGPAAELHDGEVEMIETPGLGGDEDGEKVFGGRVGFYLPGPRLEIGLSGATGEIGEIEDEKYTDITRDYDVVGFDFTWRPRRFEFRGEYVRQEVGDQPASSAPEGGVWEAWYLQGSYRFLPGRWEVAARIGEYDTPHAGDDLRQQVLGVNYVFANNFIGKLAYEFNDNPNPGERPDPEDRLLLQLSYGF